MQKEHSLMTLVFYNLALKVHQVNAEKLEKLPYCLLFRRLLCSDSFKVVPREE